MRHAEVKLKPQLGQSTTAFAINAKGESRTPRKIALVPGSQTHLTDEIHNLLRRRLRVAGLIGLAGMSYFFFKNLIVPSAAYPVSSISQFLHGVVVATMVACCALLFSRVPLGVRALRGIELALFGVMAVFFAYRQYTDFHHGQFLTWAADGYRDNVLHLGTSATGLRWALLIALYGTFIPNTWKRCAVVVGILMAIPLLLNVSVCSGCPIMGTHVGSASFDLLVVLSIGAAIAIFGSYKISELQEEAFLARKLGQYQLQRRLGAGGMGEVFLGEHILLRRACAIKLIRPEQAGDPTNLSRFEREVQAMATLTHWNTVEVYDYGHAADGTFYYVMEYLPGLSLQEMVDRHGPLTPGRVIHFLRQVCGALKEAHGIGLVHRDIKPSNVIVCERGGVHDVAKLLDFGLVVHRVPIGETSSDQKLTIQGTVLGSPPYISPEQARGKADIDLRTDIYSLGGVGYFLLTGQAPFVRESAMELLVAHIHEAAPPIRELRPEVPRDVESVLLRCLSKNPADRFADAEDLDRALAECESADHWSQEQAERWWRTQPEIASDREPMFATQTA